MWNQLGAVLIAAIAGFATAAGPARHTAEPISIAMVEGFSGSLGNGGEAAYRNLLIAVERINARGGVKLPGGSRPLRLQRYDSKGNNEEALAMLKAAIDGGASFVTQGNSSSTAAVLIDALNKHNEREPQRRVVFLNYAAVDPALTNELCSFWHFRFDAHTDMRLSVLTDVLRDEACPAVDRRLQHGERFFVVALAVVTLQLQRTGASGQLDAAARVDPLDRNQQVAIGRLAAVAEAAGEAFDHRDRDRLRGASIRRGGARHGGDGRNQCGSNLLPHRNFKSLENKNAAPNSAAWLLRCAATKSGF